MKKKSTIVELKQEGLVKNASELMGNSGTYTDMLHISLGKATWISEIEAYCGEMGILPTDLILCHKERNKPQKSKKGINTPKDGEIGSTEAGSAKNNRSNWFSDYRYKKTGHNFNK